MDKNNKIKIVLLIFLTSLCSCNKDVSTKDMIGVWECTDEIDRYFVFMPNDSCTIINFPDIGMPQQKVLCAEWSLWHSNRDDYPSSVNFSKDHGGCGHANIYYNPFSSQFYLSVMDINEDFYHYYRVTDTIPTDMDAFLKNHDRSNISQWW